MTRVSVTTEKRLAERVLTDDGWYRWETEFLLEEFDCDIADDRQRFDERISYALENGRKVTIEPL